MLVTLGEQSSKQKEGDMSIRSCFQCPNCQSDFYIVRRNGLLVYKCIDEEKCGYEIEVQSPYVCTENREYVND